MGSYGVITEALLVKSNGSTGEYSVVQKLVPSTVNGKVSLYKDGGFEFGNHSVSLSSVYHGGAFGFSEWPKSGDILITVNIPDYGVKQFYGTTRIENVNGIGKCVKCTPKVSDPTAPYTHLCLVVESPGSVFAEQVG